jgi:tRNA modification GTPase
VPSGVAVIRISGTQVPEILDTFFHSMPPSRSAVLKPIRSRNGELIDNALVLYFPAPRSFTGEDCLELHLHGGRAVVSRMLSELGNFTGTRHAEAGEFTKRAFENGKIDLVEAEGLADLISAETEMQRKLAAEQARGGLSEIYEAWAGRLTHARAMIEAELDFADEDDVPGSVSDRVWSDMGTLITEIRDHLRSARAGEIIRDGLKIVILGKPNAGKSSLLNALARRDVAIVTNIPGTTRDVLTLDLDIDGYAVKIFDTAGVRESDDIVEQEGVRRARLAAEDADLILLLQDLSDEPGLVEAPPGKDVIRIGTKSDLRPTHAHSVDVPISTISGSGVQELIERVAAYLRTKTSANSLAIPSRIRHVNTLEEALAALEAAVGSTNAGLDLRAEYLRLAARALGRITGSVDVESLLDVIFSSFCIGK